MELFWVKEAQIQANMPSSLSIGFEITDTGIHSIQSAHYVDSSSTWMDTKCGDPVNKAFMLLYNVPKRT